MRATNITKCHACDEGIVRKKITKKRCYYNLICHLCDGIGYHGIDPTRACAELPGEPLYQAVLAARQRAGLSLWHAQDRKLPGLAETDTDAPDCVVPVREAR